MNECVNMLNLGRFLLSRAAVWVGGIPGKNVRSVTNMILRVLGVCGMCEGGLSVCAGVVLSVSEVGTSCCSRCDWDTPLPAA